MPGLVDLQVEKQVLIPQLRIHVDHERAALYGVTPAAVTNALEAMSNGRRVSQIIEGNRRFDVVMRLSDHDRATTGLSDLLIATPAGHVPLRMLAEVVETDGPNQIQRENGRRRIAVYGNGDGRRDMAAIVVDMRRILAESKLPQGYSIALEGTFQAQEEATLRIGGLALVSLGIIFVVLYSRYRSTALALIVMGSISARADRQRDRAQCCRAAAFGCLDGRLHHACRHRRSQRHSEDFALHQPCSP